MASSLTRTEAPKDEPRIIIFQQPQPWQLHQPKLNQHLSRSRHHPRRKCAEAVLQVRMVANERPVESRLEALITLREM
ncbi:hypothetical protein V6N11_048030 [Hibiscus sabdariffa]|uniref:Uncharacterized protein n=1 Tax=Hibiscus sabdariffa TaxID=183260 RepID=A0ABR2NXP6_9ROSI